AGPLVGGALTQSLNWHWVFWINVPIGVVVAVLAPVRRVESGGPGRRLDARGVVLVTVGAASLIWALARTGEVGWGSPQVIGGLVVGVVMVAGFIFWESRAPEPMLPLRLFRSVSFSAANATSFLMSAALLAAGVYVSLYFQYVRGASPFGAGLRRQRHARPVRRRVRRRHHHGGVRRQRQAGRPGHGGGRYPPGDVRHRRARHPRRADRPRRPADPPSRPATPATQGRAGRCR